MTRFASNRPTQKFSLTNADTNGALHRHFGRFECRGDVANFLGASILTFDMMSKGGAATGSQMTRTFGAFPAVASKSSRSLFPTVAALRSGRGAQR